MALFPIASLQTACTAQSVKAEGSLANSESKVKDLAGAPVSLPKSTVGTKPTEKKKVIPKVPQSDLALRERLDTIFKDEVCYLVTTEEELLAYINKQEVFGLDTETSSLKWYNLTMAGFSLGTSEDSIYVPLNHDIGQNYTGNRERLINILLQKKYYGFNTKFDLLALKTVDERLLDLDFIGDGYLALRLTDNNLEAGLKAAYKEHIDPNYVDYSFSSLFSRPYTTYDPEYVYKYGAVDARKHYVVTEYFENRIKQVPKIWKLYTKLELPLIRAITSMEMHGLRMNKEYLYKLKEDLEASKAPILQRIREIVAEKSPEVKEFNPGSTKQLKEAFKARGLELTSTKEEVLEDIGDSDELAAEILKYRGVAKSISAFTTGLLDYSAEEGELTIAHPGFNQYGADCVTGDTSVLTPNGSYFIEELIPKDLKHGEYRELEIPLINRNREVEYTSHCIKFEDVPTIKITTQDGSELEGTPNHPILVLPTTAKQPEWRKLQELEVGDLIILNPTQEDAPELDSSIEYLTSPLISIEQSRNTVYDFTLPKTHSFCTNAFISHNTGRFSSSQFNVQQIPKDNRFRNIFIARPGHKLISVDYSQQEVRVLAALSQDPLMLSTFEKGKDFYSDMGANVYDLPYEDCCKNGKHKEIRQEMKSVVLGMNYDMGARSLAKSIKKSEREAQDIIDSLKRKYKVMYQYKAKVLQFAQEHGYNETVLGRRRWYTGLGYKQRGLNRFIVKGAGEQEEEIRKILPQLGRAELKKFIDECGTNKPNKITIIDREKVAFGEQRQTTNSTVQGGSADMTKLAMLAFYRDERRFALGAELACQIHDEIIIEAPDEHAEEAGKLLAEIMNGVGFDLVGIDMGGDPDIMDVWSKS